MGDSKDQVHMLCFFKTERKYGVVKSNMIIEYSSTMEIGMNSPIQQVEWPTRKGGTTKITRYSAVLVERSESAKHLERMASRLTKQGKFPNTAEHPECGQALEHKKEHNKKKSLNMLDSDKNKSMNVLEVLRRRKNKESTEKACSLVNMASAEKVSLVNTASTENACSYLENRASTEKSDYVSLKRRYESLKTDHESLKRDYEQAKLKVEVLEVFPKVVSAAKNVLRTVAGSSPMSPGHMSPTGTSSPLPDVPLDWVTTERPNSYGENWEQAALKVMTTNPSRFVGDILVAVFGKMYLASHSLSGTKSSHPNAKGKEPKPALPMETLACVRYAIRKRLGTNIGDEKIKNLVRFKLNNSNRALFTATSGKSSFVSLDPPNFPVVDSDGSSSSEADNEF